MSNWLVLAASQQRDVLRRCIEHIDSRPSITFATHATLIRELVRDSSDLNISVLIGPSDEGISDINVAAALVRDGYASRVLLASTEVSGSLKSRAHRAGIDAVIDLSDLETYGKNSAGIAHQKREECASLASLSHHDEKEVQATSETLQEQSLSHAFYSQHTQSAQKKAATLVFCAERGGVGVSTLVAGCFAYAMQWSLKVCVVDLDFAYGNLYRSFGMPTPWPLEQFFHHAREDALQSACAQGFDGSSAIMGPCDQPELSEIFLERVPDFFEVLQQKFDVVLIDASTTCTDLSAAAMQAADRVCMVCEKKGSERSEVTRLARLALRLGLRRAQLIRIYNKCPTQKFFEKRSSNRSPEEYQSFEITDVGQEFDDLAQLGTFTEIGDLFGAGSRDVAHMTAQLLAELNCLPDDKRAHKALKSHRSSGNLQIFGRGGAV